MDDQHPQMSKRKARPLVIWTRWAVGLMACLHIGVGMFLWATADTGNVGIAVMDQVAKQRALGQTLAKNAAIILDKGQGEGTRTEALSQIKATYAPFKQTHEALSRGDSSLRLPSRVPREVLKELIAAQLSYNRIVDAAAAIVAAIDDRAFPPENSLKDILAYERPYSIALAQISFLWRENIAGVYSVIFWFSLSLIILDASLIGIFYTLHEFRIYRAAKEVKDEKATMEQKKTGPAENEAAPQAQAEESEG